jgi:hypothetical protein
MSARQNSFLQISTISAPEIVLSPERIIPPAHKMARLTTATAQVLAGLKQVHKSRCSNWTLNFVGLLVVLKLYRMGDH